MSNQKMIIGTFGFQDQFRVSGSNIFDHLDPRGRASQRLPG
jgi:hypothetical protein